MLLLAKFQSRLTTNLPSAQFFPLPRVSLLGCITVCPRNCVSPKLCPKLCQTPEVGAGCGKAARPVLCEGRIAICVPTAIRIFQ
jgi:hypothetical protein